MKQGQRIVRKKSNTNVAKLLFPFYQFTQTNIQNECQSVADKKKKVTFCSNDISKLSLDRKQSGKEKSLSKQRKGRVDSLSRLISTLSKKNTVYEEDDQTKNAIDITNKNSNFLLVEIDNFKKYKHRSLSKQRSLTNVRQNSFKLSQSCTFSITKESNPFKRLKKQRSLTKLQSQWTIGRQKQKQKQTQQLHKFDTEKIDRTYDHLGKLKKATLNKGALSKKFVSFKTITKQADSISKEINSIDKKAFEQAQKQFHKKFKNSQFVAKPKPQENQLENQLKEQNDVRKTSSPSPKQAKKNYLKVSPNYNKKETTPMKTKKEKKVRASADEQLLKARLIGVNLEKENKQESFLSEINGLQSPIKEQSLSHKQKHPRIKRMSQFTESENTFMAKDHQRMSQDQAEILSEKVYFFSSRLSTGVAQLFSIEKINLKLKSNEQYVIEVVIKAYEQIVVQKIVYGKCKRSEQFRKAKVMTEKEQEKEKLKNELFAQMVKKKHIMKNRQSFPQSIHLTSQKQSLPKHSQLAAFYHHHMSQHNESIEQAKSDLMESDCGKSKESPSSMNFSQMSSQCYQSIIEYIEKYCQLEVSYLGAFLKESDHEIPLINQLMKKKHSQLQQTLLQSLNLAKILYFLIKINTTYYTAKIVILGDKKIKYYLLYEFSNMIRHERQCIIEEEEEVKEEMTKMRKNQLVAYLYHQVNKFFIKTVANGWQNRPLPDFKPIKGKHKGKVKFNKLHQFNQSTPIDPTSTQTQNIPLLNALQLCFGTIRKIGLACDIDSQSQRLYKISQSNYRNDIRWQKQQIVYGRNEKYENFFQFHNAFDYELVPWEKKDMVKENRVLFASSLAESGDMKESLMYSQHFSYTISRRFDITITLYPSAVKSKHQLIRLHPTKLRQIKLQDHFVKEQFLLLHLIQSRSTCSIINAFLKKQYILSLIQQVRQSSTPFFTTLKNKKYYVEVYVPFLQDQNPLKNAQINIMKEPVYIQLQSRISIKRYSLKMTLENVFEELKEYYRLCSDTMAYKKFTDGIRRVKSQMHRMPKEFFVQKLKFYVSKLYLMRKNTYSQFYFIPLSDLISEASHKASMMDQSKTISTQLRLQPHLKSRSIRASQKHTNLILQALQKLQCSLKQQEKSSRSTLSKIKIKNFPVYELYYKTTRRLIPGYFVIISIYYMPMFDLSQIKFYLTKVHKSFFVSIRKNIDPGQYQNIVMVLMEYIKDKFFEKIIANESDKLSSKYKDFYSRMIRQAESPFLSKTRKNKDIHQGQAASLHNSGRKHKIIKKNYAMNEVEFVQLTEELLCKVFQSKRHNKYLIRLSYPSTQQYVSQCQRKGIDQLINISILKQNCMLIYKFQTTARKLLSKKVTHKFNVIQLEYQQKNKPFYILFEEIKILIEESDQSTYGLLNTFRSYFLNKHYNTLTNNNLVSVFSINLLAGLSNNFLNSDTNLLTLSKLNNPYHFDTQKDINIKDLNSSLYQRYCLFISGNQILQVLKIRKKAKIRVGNQSNRSMRYDSDLKVESNQLTSNKSQEKYRSKTFERKKDRKQSIQAYLPSRGLLSSMDSSKTPTIRMSPPKNTNKSKVTFNTPDDSPPFPKKVDFFIEDSSHVPSYHSNDSYRPNLQQKLVYLINTDTEYVTEIPSSSEDRGFAINVPFGSYNKRMFKRFFKNVVRKVDDYEIAFVKEDDSLRESSWSVTRNVENFTLLY